MGKTGTLKLGYRDSRAAFPDDSTKEGRRSLSNRQTTEIDPVAFLLAFGSIGFSMYVCFHQIGASHCPSAGSEHPREVV